MRNLAPNVNNNSFPLSERRAACPGFFRMPPAADGRICRIKLPLGRLSTKQLKIVAQVAQTHGNDKIELTTRGNLQIRGIATHGQNHVIQALTDAGLGPLTRDGDDSRNVMVSATCGIDQRAVIDTEPIARKLLKILQTDGAFQTLSPKFSLLINGGESTEKNNHVSDIFVAPLLGGREFLFGIASCPVKVTEPQRPPIVVIARDDIYSTFVNALNLFCQWRQRIPSLERMKDLERLGLTATFLEELTGLRGNFQRPLDKRLPRQLFRPGDDYTLGIHEQRISGNYYLGIKPPLGRLTSKQVHAFLGVLRQKKYNGQIRLTAKQGFILPNCSRDMAVSVADACARLGWVVSADDALAKILCCSGRPSCASAKCDVQRDSLALARQIDIPFPFEEVHFTGCAKGCAANYPTPVTLLALNEDEYQVYIRRRQSDHRFGQLLIDRVHRSDIAQVIKGMTGS